MKPKFAGALLWFGGTALAIMYVTWATGGRLDGFEEQRLWLQLWRVMFSLTLPASFVVQFGAWLASPHLPQAAQPLSVVLLTIAYAAAGYLQWFHLVPYLFGRLWSRRLARA